MKNKILYGVAGLILVVGLLLWVIPSNEGCPDCSCDAGCCASGSCGISECSCACNSDG